MKSIYILLVAIGYSAVATAQVDSTSPLYLRFPFIPQFKIYKAADSTVFTREDLQKKKPTVFIVFSPDCEHCQRETDSLLKHIDLFKDAQIVMTTYLPHDQMVKFYHDYKIGEYPQITMGRDATFFFPPYYKIGSLPAIYVYDKKRNFKKAFEGSVNIAKVAAEL